MSLLRHNGTYYDYTHADPCLHNASGQRDAAEQIVADRLRVFQRKDKIPTQYVVVLRGVQLAVL